MSKLGTAASNAGSYMAANPELTIAGGTALSSMFTPSAADDYEAMMRAKQEGSNIAGVNYDGSGSQIDIGLVRRAQRDDLRKPTYNNRG
jgi:hypothetical protein